MSLPEIPRHPLPLTPWRRFRLWMNMLWLDHSFFRFVFNTRTKVTEGLYRSSHPMPYQLRGAKRAGIRSVLSLRGPEPHVGSNQLEWDECRKLGLVLQHFPVGSRDAPGVDQILSIKQAFETLPRPILVHCKSGADRAGLTCALFLMFEEGKPVEIAQRQLSFWRFGHVRQAKTGILDHFFDTYRVYRDAHGTGFLDWVEHHYDRDAVRASFHSSWWANQLVDFVLRRE